MRKSHGLYRRVVSKTKKFYAHDENSTARVGDFVEIEETRPMSKLKRWRLKNVVQKAKLVEQPQQQQAPPPQVIVIKDERASSSESRYGEHEFDERDRKAEAAPKPAAPANVAPPAREEPLVMTTLVYRDGHKAEVLNYAIVGSNLVDLSKGSLLKKIPLASLDLEATRRENEENGVDFHLP